MSSSPWVTTSYSANPTAACLVTVEVTDPIWLSSPGADAVFSRSPPPRFHIRRTRCRAAYAWDMTFTFQIRRQTSSDSSSLWLGENAAVETEEVSSVPSS